MNGKHAKTSATNYLHASANTTDAEQNVLAEKVVDYNPKSEEEYHSRIVPLIKIAGYIQLGPNGVSFNPK